LVRPELKEYMEKVTFEGGHKGFIPPMKHKEKLLKLFRESYPGERA